jgi:hypothetical protein
MMKALKLTWFFLCVISLSLRAQVADTLFPKPWAGCYELQVAQQDSHNQVWGKLPRRFRLLTKCVHLAGEPDFCKMKLLDASDHWISSWSLDNDDTLKLEWGTGVVGYSVTLKKSGSEFVGTAQPWSDDGGHFPKLIVDVRAIACKIQSRKQAQQRGQLDNQ